MPFEVILIVAGITILVVLLARRRLFEKRLIENRDQLANLKYNEELPEEVQQVLKKAPRLKGDGQFKYKALGCMPFAKNFEKIQIKRRIIFIEPTEIEVFLVPEPGNYERKLAVAITVDSLLLGYLPTNEASEMHKYLLAHSSGLRAKAKIYLGSRVEYNGITLDLAKPLRLEAGKSKDKKSA